MNDMKDAIVPRSDQLNSDDLITGPITIKVTDVSIRGGQEQPVSIHYDGDNGKPYKPCKSMCRVLVTVWGANAKKYIGHSMTLYRDPKVKWAGMEVGGIRISHMSGIDEPITMALTVTRANKKQFTVKPLATESARPVAEAPASPVPSAAQGGADLITADEALKLEARCTENNIPVPKVKKRFAVERLAQLTQEQLAQAHSMIDATIEARK